MRLEAAGIRTLSLYKDMICCLNIGRSRSPLKTRRAASPVTPGSRGHPRASLTTCVRRKLKQGNFIGFKAVWPSVLYRFRTYKDSGKPAISAFHIATIPANISTGIIDSSLETNWPLIECDRCCFSWFFACVGCDEKGPLPCQSCGYPISRPVQSGASKLLRKTSHWLGFPIQC